MSWATCYSGSNNIHFNTPNPMSDGRNYTNFESRCKANNEIRNSLGFKNNYQYRQWLINNGNSIMQRQNKN